jgi:cyanophycin synthetase
VRLDAFARLYRRNSRRLADLPGALERRRFKALRQEFYGELWRAAAARLGGDYVDHGGELVEIRLGDRATFLRHSDVALDSALTIEVMADKALTYELFTRSGHPTPDHLVFDLSRLDEAEGFLRGRTEPVVVKPASGTGGGRGVTTGVATSAQFRRAARHAAGFNAKLLVEEQLTGACYRLTYLDGEFVDAVRRDPPTVVGDGRSTIRDLMRRENLRRRHERPLSAMSPLIVDGDCRNTLSRQGLSPAHRPGAGVRVVVKTAVNENSSRENHSVPAEIHPTILAAGAGLVRDLGVRFAGLDLMSDDASQPYGQGRSFFTEINVNPGVHHHYLISDRTVGVDVAGRILQHQFSRNAGVMTLRRAGA